MLKPISKNTTLYMSVQAEGKELLTPFATILSGIKDLGDFAPFEGFTDCRISESRVHGMDLSDRSKLTIYFDYEDLVIEDALSTIGKSIDKLVIAGYTFQSSTTPTKSPAFTRTYTELQINETTVSGFSTSSSDQGTSKVILSYAKIECKGERTGTNGKEAGTVQWVSPTSKL